MLIFLQQYPFILAFILGLVPALIWLWFWLKEDIHPEPAKMITLSFLGGVVAVLCVIPLQKFVKIHWGDREVLSFTLWATIEETFKLFFVYYIALRNKVTDEPVDEIIYLIVGALGFVTFENTLFLLGPVHHGDFLTSIISGNLRFVGASLLHTMCSATIGICLGLSFYKKPAVRVSYAFLGLIIAVVLHTSFNLFIINRDPGDIFFIFGTVWIGIILLLLLFEKVKHIQQSNI